MITQINRAIIKAGLIRRAKTYSLILKNGMLFIVNTGPAGRELNLYGPDKILYQGVVNKVHSMIEEKVKAGEAELAQYGPQYFTSKKGCFAIPLSDITEIKQDKTLIALIPRLNIKTSKLKFTFLCSANTEAEITEFVSQLKS